MLTYFPSINDSQPRLAAPVYDSTTTTMPDSETMTPESISTPQYWGQSPSHPLDGESISVYSNMNLNGETGVAAAANFYGHADEKGEGDDLVPRPSTSPDDPLNWSWMKKNLVLLALIPGCLLSDWTLTWGTTVFQMQAPEW